MPQGTPIGGSITANERLWCSVSGCTGHRFKLSPYCCTHTERNKRTGDPLGFTPDPRQWRWEREAIAAMFAANPKHPGLVYAVAQLTSWTTRATQEATHGNHWQLEVARVMRHGVFVQEVLVEVCAAWSWLQRFPRFAPSDRAMKFCLGHAVLKLAPRPVRMSARANLTGGKGYPKRAHWRALEDIGAHLQGTLAPLIVNVHTAIQTEAEAAQQVVNDLRAPFLPSTTAIHRATTSSLVAPE